MERDDQQRPAKTTGGLLRPAEVAERLGLAPSTLRVYSVRFAPLLSPAASSPPLGPDGRPGHRAYTPADVTLLDRAKGLLADGATYDEALAALATSVGHAGVGERPIPPAELRVYLEGFHRTVAAWQALAEERAREVAELRAQLAQQQETQHAGIEALRSAISAAEVAHAAATGALQARLDQLEATLRASCGPPPTLARRLRTWLRLGRRPSTIK